MLVWLIVYQQGVSRMAGSLSILQWHAHEMIYGYAAAVLSGFLLTAVKNWTGIATLEGRPLLFIWLLWLTARVTFNFDNTLWIAMLSDLAFNLLLFGAILRSVYRARQWQQSEILIMILGLFLANGYFYAAALGISDTGIANNGIQQGIYIGLFIVLGLILTLGRRVIPFFIEKGVAEPVQLNNEKWLDNSCQLLMLSLILSLALSSFASLTVLSGVILLLLFLLHSTRLFFWHTPGIWRQPLLWSLYLGYGFIVLGFGLYLMTLYNSIFYFPAIHALAVGGIGLITLGMMCRVSLGHTGRSVQQPPKLAVLALLILLAGIVVRVVLPLMITNYYVTWILLSQLLWIAAFTSFIIAYSKILLTPDV